LHPGFLRGQWWEEVLPWRLEGAQNLEKAPQAWEGRATKALKERDRMIYE
jgi:hypothetical protein